MIKFKIFALNEYVNTILDKNKLEFIIQNELCNKTSQKLSQNLKLVSMFVTIISNVNIKYVSLFLKLYQSNKMKYFFVLLKIDFITLCFVQFNLVIKLNL